MYGAYLRIVNTTGKEEKKIKAKLKKYMSLDHMGIKQFIENIAALQLD